MCETGISDLITVNGDSLVPSALSRQWFKWPHLQPAFFCQADLLSECLVLLSITNERTQWTLVQDRQQMSYSQYILSLDVLIFLISAQCVI